MQMTPTAYHNADAEPINSNLIDAETLTTEADEVILGWGIA